jgi:pimeloyl-ACP methyl ester carboxylesterase
VDTETADSCDNATDRLCSPPQEIENMTKRLLFAACLLAAVPAGAGLFEVKLETGTISTGGGKEVSYNLFIPQPTDGLPPPPWPAVVLNHGFARSKKFHVANAAYLARRGLIVLTPDQVGRGGSFAREQNIEITLDHLEWLVTRSETPGDPLAGLVDPRRLALAGHSAGGALSFEATVRSQVTSLPVRALVLLDAVPWRSTLEAAPGLAPLDLASFRSEPSACNADGSVRGLLAALCFPVDDLRLVDATHCDPESPTDVLCRWACGGSTLPRRHLYRRLMYLFFQDALDLPSVEPLPADYEETLARLEDAGRVVREVVE